jgi:hypothetical protein
MKNSSVVKDVCEKRMIIKLYDNIYAFSRGVSMSHELILSVEQAGINKTQAQVLISIGLFGTGLQP